MRRRSQWMFFARREGTDIVVGRIIQRITFEMVRGLIEVERRVERKFWIEVEELRERRLIVQTGIFTVACWLSQRIGNVEIKERIQIDM
jgi:hypothetical protein